MPTVSIERRTPVRLVTKVTTPDGKLVQLTCGHWVYEDGKKFHRCVLCILDKK